jgi:hypothetical protein
MNTGTHHGHKATGFAIDDLLDLLLCGSKAITFFEKEIAVSSGCVLGASRRL